MATTPFQPWDEQLPIDEPRRKLALNLPQLLPPLSASSASPATSAAPSPLMTAQPSTGLAVQPPQPKPLAEQYGDVESKITQLQSQPTTEPHMNVGRRILGTMLAMSTNPQMAKAGYGWTHPAEVERGKQLGTLETQAEGIKTRADIAAKEKPPKQTPEKPENLQQAYADAVQDAQSRGVDPAKDPKVQQLADAITSLQKQPAGPKDSKPVAGVSKGKPAWGQQTETGWIDPQTKQSIPDFTPAPSFAETGLWDPTEVATPEGKIVPGKINKRTGEVTTATTKGNVALPKDVAGQFGKVIADATDADKLLRSMNDSYKNAINSQGQAQQQAMVNLLTAHVGMTLGQIPGRRLNREFFNEAMSSSPILQRIEAHFDDRGYLSGVVLTPDQMRQMVELGQQRRGQAWGRVTDTGQAYGVNVGNVPPADVRGGANQPVDETGGLGAPQQGERSVTLNGKFLGYTVDGKTFSRKVVEKVPDNAQR